MKKHSPTEKQKKAFKDVITAINKAKRLGLVFYGKCNNLVAYTEQANEYFNGDFEMFLGTGFSQIENLCENVLSDSGGDDYSQYKTQADYDEFN
jgi:hypothetical protein